MKQIPLSQGKFALVDDDDYDYLMQWKWHYTHYGYAARGQHGAGEKKKWVTRIVYMHRELMNTPKGVFIDHADRNKLNNQKENLRVCTRHENNRNVSKPRNNTSGYKGVFWHKRNGKWIAALTFNRKGIHLGCFTDIHEAARAYNAAALKYHGEYAQLNEV